MHGTCPPMRERRLLINIEAIVVPRLLHTLCKPTRLCLRTQTLLKRHYSEYSPLRKTVPRTKSPDLRFSIECAVLQKCLDGPTLRHDNMMVDAERDSALLLLLLLIEVLFDPDFQLWKSSNEQHIRPAIVSPTTMSPGPRTTQ